MGRTRTFNRPAGIHAKSNASKRRTQRLKKLLTPKPLQACHESHFSVSSSPVKGGSVKHVYPTQFQRSSYRVVPVKAPMKFILRKTTDLPPEGNKSGYRLVNLEKMSLHMVELSVHCASCTKCHSLVAAGGIPIKMLGEVSRKGLASVLQAQCRGCGKVFRMETSDLISLGTSSKKNAFDVNVRSVWGQMSTGGGRAKLDEVCGSLGMPSMSQDTFSKLEMHIGNWWEGVLLGEMKEAVREERELAIARGNFHQGVPAITVLVDGRGVSVVTSIATMPWVG